MNGRGIDHRRNEVDTHTTFDAAASEAVVVGKGADSPQIVFEIALAKFHPLIHLPKIEQSDLKRVCRHQQCATCSEWEDALLLAKNIECVGFHLRSHRHLS